MTLNGELCLVCGRGRKERLDAEGSQSRYQDIIYKAWRAECSETLCEILFGSNSLLPLVRNAHLCICCEQTVRDAHFSYRQLRSFHSTLQKLADLLRQRIRCNHSSLTEPEKPFNVDAVLSLPLEPEKYSHTQRTFILHTVASRFEWDIKESLSKNERIVVKNEPVDRDDAVAVSVDFWNYDSSTEEVSKSRTGRKRRKVKRKEVKWKIEDVKCKGEDTTEFMDAGDEWSSQTIKRKRGRPKKKPGEVPQKRKGTVRCSDENCLFKFTTEEKMKAHFRGFHQGIEKPHECPECSKGFSRRKMMMHHVRVVHKKRKSPYSHFCKFCSKGYLNEEELKEHYGSAHLEGKPFGCAFCEEVYSNSVDLRLHMKKVHPDPEDLLRPQCAVCHKYFSNQNNLMVHSRLHGDPDLIPKCVVCSRIFSNKGSLKKHTNRYHSEEVRYTCETCGKGFKYLPDLNEHAKKRHNDMKKYQCKLCDKRFSTSSKCKLHEVTHTGIKEHVCDLCGKAFAFKGNLTVHQKLHSRPPQTTSRRKKDNQPTEAFIPWTDFPFNPVPNQLS